MNKFKSIIGAIFLILFLCFSYYCNTDTSKSDISMEELIEDLTYLVEIIKDAHCDPYRLISESEFDKALENAVKEIKNNNQSNFTQAESYFILQEFISHIQDEHTQIRFPDNIFGGIKLLPFTFRIIENRFFIKGSINDSPVPEMAEVLEINGKPVSVIHNECLKYINYPIDHAKNIIMEKYIYYYTSFLYGMKSPWILKYKTGSEVKSHSAEGVSADLIFQEVYKSAKYNDYSITKDDMVVPVLDLPSFSYGDIQNYKRYIDNFFSMHWDDEAIIIDIRQNPGGHGVWGFYLLDFFTENPYAVSELFTFKVSDLFRNSGYRSKAGDNLNDADNGDYILSNMENLWTPHQTGRKFNGEVYLLVSHATNSAGVVFAAAFKYNRIGRVIGRETAGRLEFSSDPVSLVLPNSGLQFYIPVAIFRLPGDDPDRGVMPDIEVEYSAEDMIRDIDKDVEKVFELMKEKGKSKK